MGKMYCRGEWLSGKRLAKTLYGGTLGIVRMTSVDLPGEVEIASGVSRAVLNPHFLKST